MAMTVTLRTKAGADVANQDIGPLTAYPDIINYAGQAYVLKRVMSDKQSAYYYEASSLDITPPEQAA